MKVSSIIKQLANKPFSLDGADHCFFQHKTLELNLSSSVMVKLTKDGENVFGEVMGTNQLCVISHALWGKIQEVKVMAPDRKFDEIEFREVENMLRDLNSVPSFPSELYDEASSVFLELKTLNDRLNKISELFEDHPELRTSIVGKNFFDQVSLLDKTHQMFIEYFGGDRMRFPRLNTWDPKISEISFLVDGKTTLSLLEMQLLRHFWSEIEPIVSIKMVAR